MIVRHLIDEISIIDTLTGQVSFGGTLSYPVVSAAVIQVNDMMYAFAGINSDASSLNNWQYAYFGPTDAPIVAPSQPPTNTPSTSPSQPLTNVPTGLTANSTQSPDPITNSPTESPIRSKGPSQFPTVDPTQNSLPTNTPTS
eukprot:536386_1